MHPTRRPWRGSATRGVGARSAVWIWAAQVPRDWAHVGRSRRAFYPPLRVHSSVCHPSLLPPPLARPISRTDSDPHGYCRRRRIQVRLLGTLVSACLTTRAYLLSSYSLTVFSPSGKLVQIEHALAAVSSGTTSLGIKGPCSIHYATRPSSVVAQSRRAARPDVSQLQMAS